MYDIMTMKKVWNKEADLTLETVFSGYCDAKDKNNFMQTLYFSW